MLRLYAVMIYAAITHLATLVPSIDAPYADPITQKPAGQIPLNLSIKQPYAIRRPLLLLFEAQQICNGGNY